MAPVPSPPPSRPDVTLTPLGREHAGCMARWMQDPAVRDNVGVRQEPSLERTSAWIERALTDASVRPFAILCSDVHVGNVILDRIDPHLQTARLSIYVGEATARGSGVGRTAAALALREAFTQLLLRKVWLTVHARNAAALRTYAALGFQTEGVLREEFLWQGEWLDALYLGLLAREYAGEQP